MGKTESLFAGILLAAVVMAVLLVVFRGDGGGPRPDGDRRWQPDTETVFAGFTGNSRDDLCTCYEQAYGYGMRRTPIESAEYRGGFAECSRRLGNEGAEAWTAGWSNGERAPASPRSCRAWFSGGR